jgi:hypothetical protein
MGEYYEKVRNIVKPYSTYSLKKTINFMGINAKSVRFTDTDLTKWEDERGGKWGASANNENNWENLYENLIYDKELEKEDFKLKVGNIISCSILDAWTREGDNYLINTTGGKGWHPRESHFVGSRDIIKLCRRDGKEAFQVYGTTWNVWLNAEGFEEFYMNFNKPVTSIRIENWFSHLKIGTKIDGDILNAWTGKGKNYFIKGEWKDQVSGFVGSRKIERVDYRQGCKAFQVEGTTSDLWINAEGFEEFYNNYTEPKLVRSYWKEVKCIRAASGYYTVGEIYAVDDKGRIKDNDGNFNRFLDSTTTFSGLTNNDSSDFEEYVGPQKIALESNIEKAERLYPAGTKFISPENNKISTSVGKFRYGVGSCSGDVVVDVEESKTDSVFVYYEYRWAEILTPEPSFDGPGMPYTTPDIVMVINYPDKTVTKLKAGSKWTYGLNLVQKDNPFLLKRTGKRLLKEDIQTTRVVDVKIKR